MSDALRPLSDPVAVQKIAMTVLGRHLEIDRAFYAEVDENDGCYVINDPYSRDGVASIAGRLPIESFGEESEMLRRGQTIMSADVARSTDLSQFVKGNIAAVGVQAYVAVPLFKAKRWIALVGLHSGSARVWTPAEVSIVQETVERTWDAVERGRAEAALRTSEERLRQFGEASQDILWIRDAETLQWVYLTPAFETIYGLSRQEALTGDDYRKWQDLIVPEDREHALASIAEVRTGAHVTFEFRIPRPSDGAIRWLRNTDFPITDETGKVVLFGGVGHDFTEARKAELRFRSLVEGMPQLIWSAVADGQWTWASPQRTAFTGQEEADYQGRGWLDALHPDDRADACEAWSRAFEDEGFKVDYRLKRRRDGRHVWFQTRAVPIRDHAGTIVEWLGTSTDIDELRGLQELQKTLLAELQHRVRNILEVTHSIVSRSNDGERPTEDYVQHLQGRISALARTQVLLTRRAGAGVDLQDMIRDEFLSQVASEDQFVLDGSDVVLSPKAAEGLTLAVHELATNATKYGAFSRASGRLSIRWNVDDREGQCWLTLDWSESGVPIIDAAPRRRGFGTELVSRRIPYELKGNGHFELEPGGLQSRISFPPIAGDSILRTDGIGA